MKRNVELKSELSTDEIQTPETHLNVIFLLCAWVLCLPLCLHTTYVQELRKPEEGDVSP